MFGRGFGFRGASPPWPYIGRGRGGLPRCWYPGLWGVPVYGYPTITKEQELDFLKSQAELLREELNQLEARIKELEGGK
ncbi:DUF5320 domain-containing protein [bacterium]|nr:DUF5320 domain-containing protein [bacterium]